MLQRKRAVLFSLYLFPFLLNIALIDFLIPIKYDLILENLPFLGFLVTLAWLGSSLITLAVGDITDRIGVRKTVQTGVLLSCAGSLLFGLSSDFALMTAGVFLWAVSYLMVTVPADTFVFSAFPKNYRGSAYGYFYFFYDFSYAIAPFLCFALVSLFGADAAIVAAAVIVLFTFPAAFGIRGKGRQGIFEAVGDVIRKDGFIKKELDDIRHLNAQQVSLLFNMFAVGFMFMTIMIGAPLLFFHESHNLLDAALLAFAFMLPFSILDILYGRIANSRRARLYMINFGFSAAAVLLFLFYLTDNFYALLGLAAAITLTGNMAWTASEVHISDHLPRGRKGEFVGVFTMGKDLGFDFAPLFYGMLAVLGLKVPFLALGVILFIAWLFFGLTHNFGRG